MICIEGDHQVRSMIAKKAELAKLTRLIGCGGICQFYNLGARYIFTTHNCDNASATAASTVAPGGEDHGRTPFGHEYVKEKRIHLGKMDDLSHVSH